MPLSVTFTDNADGTGATATISGTAGAAVEVFAQVVNAGGWSPVGSRTGDGPVPVTTPVGLRWGYARTAAEQTAPVPFAVTGGGGLALATRCRDAVQATVLTFALEGCRGVIEKPYPDPANADFPVVWVTADGVRETIEPGLNATNDIAYPVRVLIVDRHELRDKARLRERYEPWRARIVEAFLDKRLAGVPESVQCLIEPLPVLDPNLPQYQFVVSGLVVRCRTRKPR
jgi:hypothetical protein